MPVGIADWSEKLHCNSENVTILASLDAEVVTVGDLVSAQEALSLCLGDW